jgi:hypothetical protein
MAFRFNSSHGFVVPYKVFRFARNAIAIRRLARLPANRTWQLRGREEMPLFVFPRTKDPGKGTLYQRHQDHERPVRASIAPHLLRRAITCEGAAENGRKGHRSAAQAGIFDSSDETRTDQKLTSMAEGKVNLRAASKHFRILRQNAARMAARRFRTGNVAAGSVGPLYRRYLTPSRSATSANRLIVVANTRLAAMALAIVEITPTPMTGRAFPANAHTK